MEQSLQKWRSLFFENDIKISSEHNELRDVVLSLLMLFFSVLLQVLLQVKLKNVLIYQRTHYP